MVKYVIKCGAIMFLRNRIEPHRRRWWQLVYTMGATSGTGTAYPSEALKFIPSF